MKRARQQNSARVTGLQALLMGALCMPAHAATVYWTNMNSSANWSDPGSWTATPTGADTVQFTNSNTYTVNFPAGTDVATTNAAATFNAKAGAGGAMVALNIGSGNTWVITNGNFRISGTVAADSNALNNVTLTSGTLVNTNPANGFFIGAYGKGALTVSNGATVMSGKLAVGNNAGSAGVLTIAGGSLSNIIGTSYIGYVGTGTVWVLGGALDSAVTLSMGSANNGVGSMTVSNGTVNLSAGLNVGGSAAGTTGARGTVTVAGGVVKIGGTLQVGRTSSTGTVFVSTGGVLEANTITLGGNAANGVANDGGVYQFTSATPTFTVTGSGGISLHNGTIGFRAITNADVNSALTGISFSGSNTFMLNAASNTAGSAQAYTFDTGSRYANLALVNGATAYRNGDVTIGSGGSFLAKDTKATVTSAFTNSGAVTLLRSVVNFGNAVVLNGSSTWQQDFGTNSSAAVVSGSLTLNGTVTLNVADAGGFAAQTYTVLTYNASAPIAGAGTLTVGTMPSGFIAGINTNTQGVVLLQVIQADGAPLTQFSGNPTSGTEPLLVNFADQSFGSPTSWAWDFGDGNTSTNQNPSHSYTNGTYTVRLIAYNGFGCTTNIKPVYIVATVSNAPSASFTAVPTHGVEPLLVSFTDQSTGSPTSWAWDFGDGVTSTSQNPSHSYTNGTWTVSLIASNASGASAPATKTIWVLPVDDTDSDGDGIPDWWMAQYFGHATGLSNDLSRAQDDYDGDGLTNLEEYQTITIPVDLDTDGDDAGDWYEIYASFTDPTNSADKPNIPYPLPKPDSFTGATNKPVKVFILMGQSNMAGLGAVDPINTNGTLATIVKLQNKFPYLLDTNGNWSVRKDVLFKGTFYVTVPTNMIVGLGETSEYIGPELGFGHVMGYALDEPVLVIKSAMGGRSLGYDYLPPGSERYTINGTNYAGYGDWAQSWPTESSPPSNETSYAGYWYSNCVTKAKSVLANFNTSYPQYAAQGYQVAGFCWVQGEADSGSAAICSIYSSRYETNLVNFINTVRADFGVTNAPFVIATLGQNGTNMTGRPLTVCNAQLAVGDPTKHPEFAGTVKTMDSREYWRPVTQSPSPNQAIHYYGNTETYMLMGDALGRGMIDLLNIGMARDCAISSSFGPVTGSFTYTRRVSALAGDSHTVEISTNLLNWTTDVGAVQTPGDSVGDIQSVLVTISPALLTQPLLFVRIRAIP